MRSTLQKLKPVFLIAVLAFMIWGLWALRGQLGAALATADRGLLIGAAAIAAIYLGLNASVWGLILRLVKPDVSRFRAAKLWIECEAMRWLPGGIWGYASRVVDAKRIGVAKGPAGFSLLVELVITVAAWATLGLLGGLLSPRLREAANIYLEKFQLPPTSLFVLAGLGALAVAVVLGLDLLKLRTKLLRSSGELIAGLKQWPITLRAYLEYLILSVFYAFGFLLCLKAIGVDPSPSLLEAAGSYGLAWIVGFFAFGAPGGMGVREGFLYLVFQPLGIGAQVATAAILWRAIQIIVELVLLVLIKTTGRRQAEA